MGVVYRAVDTRLNRTVAIKVIGDEAASWDRRQRFLTEARAASAFNHPNIVTIYEVDAAGNTDYLVMELVSGLSLDKRIAAGDLPIDEVLGLAEQIASALDTAHASGIVHRDVKPANVMVTDTGQVKMLDFGIAKQLAPAGEPDASTLSLPALTRPGLVIGSLAYMSPEQAQGRVVDGQSDIFSFGVLLYEMLSGRRPFGGTTEIETIARILEGQPAPIAAIRPDVPAALSAIVSACLAKDRFERPTARAVLEQVSAIRRSRTASSARVRDVLRRPAVLIPAAIVIAAIAAGGAWWWIAGRDVRDARRRLPAILAKTERRDAHEFYRQARTIVALLPDETRLQEAWNNLTFSGAIDSQPRGADVSVKGYAADDWITVGRTPIDQARLPIGTTRIKVAKDGYAPFDGTITTAVMNFTLDPLSGVPDGMIRVPDRSATVEGANVTIPSFWLDRFELSNRQFKAFVDAGGYRSRQYWVEPFIDNGRPISWEDAMARFRDATGRPGPSTWELGSYPQGQADYPVSGVSWYEAAAFAVFAGKSLPTAFQWRAAGDFAGPSAVFGDILLGSNFSTKGPVAIGSTRGISPFGSYDMAGNVKEWCWNESRGGRMVLGGAWNEPTYMYADTDAQPPLARRPTYGVRLVKNITPPAAASLAYLPPFARDYAVEKPIDDNAFSVARSAYRYDPLPLNARVDKSEDAPDWRRYTVTLDAAYGNERIIVYLYLPRAAAPPYQTVVYFPGGDATFLRSSRLLNLTNVDFLIRSGRALVFPVYKGTYERGPTQPGINAYRDVTIARVKYFGRVLDYLETRADLDRERIGYYGASLGAYSGVLIGAIETRLKAMVLMGGGLARVPVPQEIDPLNFAPRLRLPTLMVNGEGDFQYPLETTQRPLFRLLGADAERKHHALFTGGHMPLDIHDVMREILDWFDRFLGPVDARAR